MKDSTFSAVVFTSGRSGSHLTEKNLSNYFKSNLVIQTHNPLLELPHKNTIPVISRRRSMFDAIISMFAASRIDKFHWNSKDSNIRLDPFNIDVEDFKNMFVFHTAFDQTIKLRNFTNSVDIFYEDMIADPKYLFSKFNIDHPIENLLMKSPYDANSTIINIAQLQDLYDQLVLSGISETDYNFFIENVVNDLDDIKKNHGGNRYSNKQV